MKYQKNKIQSATFSNVIELVQDMMESAINLEEDYSAVTLVANPELTQKVFRTFSNITVNGLEVEYGMVEINNEEYDDLYYLTFGKDGRLWVEPAWHEDNQWHKAGYLQNESDINYIEDLDINDEIMDVLEDANVLTFAIMD